MKLISLKLKNFKGIKELSLEPNGKNINVFGDNATGKTTIFDSISWLLFDKDSSNRKDFEIKTLDVEGKPLHHLEHEVEGVFSLNNRMVELRKVYKEKWTRKRGQAIESFDGHTTDYFIDGVPLKTKREYDNFVTSILDEKIFKLLTNPLFFNENIEWSERRNIILQVCGDIAENDVINSNLELADLKKMIDSGKTIKDIQAIAKSKQSAINNELKMIPVRISELQNSMVDIAANEVDLKTQIELKQIQISDKEKDIIVAENGQSIIQAENELKNIELSIKEMLATANKANDDKRKEIQENFYAEKDKLNEVSSKISEFNSDLLLLSKETKANDESIENLRKRFTEVNNKNLELKAQEDCNCGFCGQKLPEEMIEENKRKLSVELNNFNLKKSQELAGINEKGKALSVENSELKTKMDNINAEIEELKKEKIVLMNRIKEISDQLEKIKDLNIATTPEVELLNSKKEELVKSIAEQKNSTAGLVEQLKSQSNSLKDELNVLNEKLGAFNQAVKTRERIKELEDSQKALAQEYEEYGRQIFLTEEFTKRKVDMLQEKINSKFALARFKMFSENVTNDGIAECCETTFNGVPYKDLNNAAKINIGLDIIKTLSEHYDFEAPIFIDNAEAVTNLVDMGNIQIIRLVVSGQDKVLRVDNNENILKEAI